MYKCFLPNAHTSPSRIAYQHNTHTLRGFPWYGLQIPLTLSLILSTGFVTFFSFSPDASRSKIAFSSTSSFRMFLTQMAFSRPLMYVPLMTGCLFGRGETVISTWGFARAKAGSVVWRKELTRILISRYS